MENGKRTRSSKSRASGANARKSKTSGKTAKGDSNPLSGFKPRNIVLLADGTGNSSASFHKTNVWKLYQALDLGPDGQPEIGTLAASADDTYRQMAFYADGVGTSGPKIVMLISQALGLGVSRNVRKLYAELCQHYQPGDRVYIFGFSRGAFTARVLCDMIAKCGILDREQPAPNMHGVSMEAEEGLFRGVAEARRAYRNIYWERAGFFPRMANRAYRWVREHVFRQRNYYVPMTDSAGNPVHFPPDRHFMRCFSHPIEVIDAKSDYKGEIVTFLGVWDTVDAHGLPIDELSDIVNAVYPYKYYDFKLSPHVRRARHVIAIDDERESFHPLLFDEEGEPEGRIKQVWFSGMHADVGGGYPEQALADITLDWMMGEIEDDTADNGLRFQPDSRQAIGQRAQPTGLMHDSRRGAASYYRYKPRNINDLSENPFEPDRKLIAMPLVHQSVLDRIQDEKAGYAPAGLPGNFHIETLGNTAIDQSERPRYRALETDRDRRVAFHERTRHHIFWRRFTYFVMLFATLFLFALPFFEPRVPGWLPLADGGWFEAPKHLLVSLLEAVRPFIPFYGFLSFWLEAWAQAGWWFLVLGGSALAAFFWSFRIAANIQRLSEAGWWQFKGNRSLPYTAGPQFFERRAADLKRLGGFLMSFTPISFFFGVLLPFVFLLALVLAVWVGAWRFFSIPDDAARKLCSQPPVSTVEKRSSASFTRIEAEIAEPCIRSGVRLTKGKRYNIRVVEGVQKTPSGFEHRRTWDLLCSGFGSTPPWRDHRIPGGQGASHKGLSCVWDQFRLANFTDNTAKRIATYPWMVLTGQIGLRSAANTFPVHREIVRFTAPVDGELVFYVNQKIDPGGLSVGPEHQYDPARTTVFYRKLQGRMAVVVTELD